MTDFKLTKGSVLKKKSVLHHKFFRYIPTSGTVFFTTIPVTKQEVLPNLAYLGMLFVLQLINTDGRV